MSTVPPSPATPAPAQPSPLIAGIGFLSEAAQRLDALVTYAQQTARAISTGSPVQATLSIGGKPYSLTLDPATAKQLTNCISQEVTKLWSDLHSITAQAMQHVETQRQIQAQAPAAAQTVAVQTVAPHA